MLRNYLNLTIRNLRRSRIYTVINIAGLAIGIAVCLVIWRYVEFEMSYDSFHDRADNIYRATFTEYGKNWNDDWFATFGYGLGPALSKEIPEVNDYARIHPLYGDAAHVSFDNPRGERSVFQEKDIYFADPSFVKMFTYESMHGEVSQALVNPSSVVITAAVAARYFGQTDPIGKSLHVATKDWGDDDYTITAVISDVPENAHLQFDILLSMHNLLQTDYYRDPDAAWTATNFTTYVEMVPGTDVRSLDAKTKRFMDEHTGTEPLGVRLSYQPLRQMNFSPDLNSANGHLKTLYFFILISVFILGIAWVNYVNLSTARATERAKEVGVKKAMGVMKHQLMMQFMFEALLINFISVLVAFGLATALLPEVSKIVGKNITFDYSQPLLWYVLGALLLFGTLISGAYPAFVLASFNATEVIKGTRKAGKGLPLRRALVVFQFTASLLLITGTFIINRQLDFMLTRDKGLSTDKMLIVTGPQIIGEEGNHQRMTSFKNELLKIPSVTSVTTSGAIPGGGFSFTTGMETAGSPHDNNAVRESIHVVWVDTDFIRTYGMRILSGKPWNADNATEMQGVFINETTVRRFGLGTVEQALNERVIIGGESFAIQGVLKDFHWNSLKSGYVPMLFRPQPANYNLFSVQLNGNIQKSVKQVERTYQRLFPGNPFDYYFLDDFFNSQYQDEKQFEKIFSLFSILAIVIACLGLWGLASFTTLQRRKEVSIRKVLGATVGSIVSLLSAQFLKLLGIASVIALPIAVYAANSWMNNFAFRMSMTLDLFIVPFATLCIIALATVSTQTLRGARTSPADVLRAE